MDVSIELKQDNLNFFPSNTARPLYNRDKLKTGIVHIGVGGFHRAHQAFYTDELLNSGHSDEWAICGIGIREEDRDVYNALKKQDFLYTLMVRHPDGKLEQRVIGSITDYILAIDDPQQAVEKLSDPQVKIVSLTITEGGYNFNQATGEFNFDAPDIQWDLNHHDQPKTVFGYLASALQLRKDRGLPAFTILSCDNLQHNGDITKKMILAYTGKLDKKLSFWTEKNVSFPNCMVDRITPVTTDREKEDLLRISGIRDAWPVTCEPYIQWVIEDNFADGRPAWEKAGVQFVKDVDPYEKMKIRLLNAGHTLLGFTGSLMGYSTIDETIGDPVLKRFLRVFMDQEVTPVLGEIEGVNLEQYKESLIRRFGNPNIKDQLTRICSESSAKIPKFLIPTINEQLEKNGSIKCGTLVLASWCRFLELSGTPGFKYKIQDEMLNILEEHAKSSALSNPLGFLEVEPVFGNLVNSKRFTDTYLALIESIRQYGIEYTINKLNQL